MKNIHKQFVQLGRQRNQLTYKLLALLPEINEKKIFLKHGCNSIVEYAGKFGGLTREVVKKTLKVHKDVEDKPHLKVAIEKVGIHKVGIVSGAATKETEKSFAKIAETMDKASLQILSKEVRNNGSDVSVQANKDTQISSCKASPVKMNIDLDEEMQFLFLKLKKEFDKELSNKEALKKMLSELGEYRQEGKVMQSDNRNTKQQKIENVTKIPGEIRDKSNKKLSRYIPVKVKKAALAKTGGRCAYPGCNKPVELFHHRERFSETKNHSSIIPLCKCHHEFAHNGLIINEQKDPKYWQLAIPWTNRNLAEKQTTIKPQKGYADTFYQLYKQGAL